jgi:hypothetical protein
MARTKSFKALVQHHVKRDKKFAEALLREGVDAMLSGDVKTGKIILRDYIKATVGFEKLGAAACACTSPDEAGLKFRTRRPAPAAAVGHHRAMRSAGAQVRRAQRARQARP